MENVHSFPERITLTVQCILLSAFFLNIYLHFIKWRDFAASVFLNPWSLLSRGMCAHTSRLSGAGSLPLKGYTMNIFFNNVVNHIYSVVNWSL